MWSLHLVIQALTCVPHPPVPGERALLRATDRASAPVAGLVVQVEDPQRRHTVTLPATDGRGEAPWTPQATGLHIASAQWRAGPAAAPVELLLAIEVPAPFYGTPGRVAMVVAGVLLIALNLHALRRARRAPPPAVPPAPSG